MPDYAQEVLREMLLKSKLLVELLEALIRDSALVAEASGKLKPVKEFERLLREERKRIEKELEETEKPKEKSGKKSGRLSITSKADKPGMSVKDSRISTVQELTMREAKAIQSRLLEAGVYSVAMGYHSENMNDAAAIFIPNDENVLKLVTQYRIEFHQGKSANLDSILLVDSVEQLSRSFGGDAKVTSITGLDAHQKDKFIETIKSAVANTTENIEMAVTYDEENGTYSVHIPEARLKGNSKMRAVVQDAIEKVSIFHSHGAEHTYQVDAASNALKIYNQIKKECTSPQSDKPFVVVSPQNPEVMIMVNNGEITIWNNGEKEKLDIGQNKEVSQRKLWGIVQSMKSPEAYDIADKESDASKVTLTLSDNLGRKVSVEITKDSESIEELSADDLGDILYEDIIANGSYVIHSIEATKTSEEYQVKKAHLDALSCSGRDRELAVIKNSEAILNDKNIKVNLHQQIMNNVLDTLERTGTPEEKEIAAQLRDAPADKVERFIETGDIVTAGLMNTQNPSMVYTMNHLLSMHIEAMCTQFRHAEVVILDNIKRHNGEFSIDDFREHLTAEGIDPESVEMLTEYATAYCEQCIEFAQQPQIETKVEPLGNIGMVDLNTDEGQEPYVDNDSQEVGGHDYKEQPEW